MILCHGLTNDRFTCPLIERANELFLQNGAITFRFDFFGSGASDGIFREKTISEMITNLEDAIRFMASIKGIDSTRVGIWGRSVGGVVAAACSNPTQIKTNILVSAPVLVYKTFYPLYERFGQADFSPIGKAISDAASGKVKGALELPRTFFQELLDLQGKIADNLSRMKSVLIVQGNQDKKVSPENAYFIYERVGDPKQLEIIDGADHAYSGKEVQVMNIVSHWFSGAGSI